MTDPLARCFEPARVKGLTLRNRLIKAATFEGKTPGGVPGEDFTRLHVRIGEGGVGMTTLAYCAAEADGRMHENMMHMHEGIRPQLEALIARVKATGTRVSGQLGHCGNFSKNRGLRTRRPLGPSPAINSLGLAAGLPFAGALTVAQIRERVEAFAAAARFMQSVGFDAIEIHFGHGYAISQFISPRTNRRTDEYGGSLHNRMRFGLEVLAAVRAAVGDEFPLLGKISMSDGVRGGVGYADSVEIAAMLEKGGLDVVVCSGGTSSMNPMLLFRGDSLLAGMLEQEKNPLMRFGPASRRPEAVSRLPVRGAVFPRAGQANPRAGVLRRLLHRRRLHRRQPAHGDARGLRLRAARPRPALRPRSAEARREQSRLRQRLHALQPLRDVDRRAGRHRVRAAPRQLHRLTDCRARRRWAPREIQPAESWMRRHGRSPSIS
jgi:2,4-dienoyl-CoA reductase-like NADH-dependent reductase (Old Yellow Enzyme family)